MTQSPTARSKKLLQFLESRFIRGCPFPEIFAFQMIEQRANYTSKYGLTELIQMGIVGGYQVKQRCIDWTNLVQNIRRSSV